MSEREPDSFLGRWSRLKARARDETEASVPTPVEPLTPVLSAESAETTGGVSSSPADPAQGATGVPLPDIDTLGADSDYSAFLAPGVDALLRRRALRKLFHSPKFNVLDGLDDYMGDFTSFEPLGNLVTADMRHQIERAARRVAETLDQTADEARRAPAPETPRPEEAPPDDGPAGAA
jgi:hypothetical protein